VYSGGGLCEALAAICGNCRRSNSMPAAAWQKASTFENALRSPASVVCCSCSLCDKGLQSGLEDR
jgi:hypothetical protein